MRLDVYCRVLFFWFVANSFKKLQKWCARRLKLQLLLQSCVNGCWNAGSCNIDARRCEKRRKYWTKCNDWYNEITKQQNTHNFSESWTDDNESRKLIIKYCAGKIWWKKDINIRHSRYYALKNLMIKSKISLLRG